MNNFGGFRVLLLGGYDPGQNPERVECEVVLHGPIPSSILSRSFTCHRQIETKTKQKYFFWKGEIFEGPREQFHNFLFLQEQDWTFSGTKNNPYENSHELLKNGPWNGIFECFWATFWATNFSKVDQILPKY